MENIEKCEDIVIEQAIESAKNRIYWLMVNDGHNGVYRVSTKHKQKLMDTTIKALEFYRDNRRNRVRCDHPTEKGGTSDA